MGQWLESEGGERGELAVSTGSGQGVHDITGSGQRLHDMIHNSGIVFCFFPDLFDLMFTTDVMVHFHVLIPLRQVRTLICHMVFIVGTP